MQGCRADAGLLVESVDALVDEARDRQVALLAYNEQTSGPESEAVLKAAKTNGIAVLPVTETLPAGKNYVSWMQGYLKALQSDLG